MTKAQIKKRIYPSVVTFMGDWRTMIADVRRLELTDISLFLTGIGYRERRELYKLLDVTDVRRIPHVHARHDMREAEYDWLVERFGTKAFTLHFQHIKSVIKSKHRKKIFIENNDKKHRIRNVAEVAKVGGVCIDLSHYEEFQRRSPKLHETTVEAVKRYKIGCNHLSAVQPSGKSWHYAKSASELDYVATIPKKYFSRYINIELANSIPEQLRFREYIANLLFKVWR